jgi:hypothetical protein
MTFADDAVPVAVSPNGDTARHQPVSPDCLALGTADGVVLIEAGGGTDAWRVTGRALAGRHIGALAHDGNGMLFAGCHNGGGVHRSADGGRTWVDVSGGLPARHIFSLASVPGPAGPLLLAGVEPVGLFVSADGGDHWEDRPALRDVPGAENWTFPPPPHIPHVKSIAIDPRGPGRIYACVEQGALLWSGDFGQSWTDVDQMWHPDDPIFRDAHRVLVAPWNHQLLLLTTGMGLYRSTDGGIMWRHHSAISAAIRYPDGLVATGPDQRRLFVCGALDNPLTWIDRGAAASAVYCSDDDGASWQPAGQGLPERNPASYEALAIATWPGGYRLFLADTDGQLFSRSSSQPGWSKIADGLPAISKGEHFKLARFARRLPAWVRPALYSSALAITGVTRRWAGRRRRRAYRASG